MADLSNFKRGQIVGVRMAGAWVTKTADLLGVTWCTITKVMIAFEKEGKTSSRKQNSGRKRKLSDRDRRTFRRIVWKDHKTTGLKITVELNDHLENTVSLKTVRRELHKAGFHRCGMLSENHIKINLLKIFWCFHYFVQALYIPNPSTRVESDTKSIR